MLFENQDVTFVARHQIISGTGFGHGQQKIVVWIARPIDDRQFIQHGSKSMQVVDEATGMRGCDEGSHNGSPRDFGKFGDLCRRRHQGEDSVDRSAIPVP